MTKGSIQPFLFTLPSRSKTPYGSGTPTSCLCAAKSLLAYRKLLAPTIYLGRFGSDFPGPALLRPFPSGVSLQIAALSNPGADTSAIAVR